MKWFEQQWGSSDEKKKWIPTVEALIAELWLEYKDKYSARPSNLPYSNSLPQQPNQEKTYTSAQAHKRLKVSHQDQSTLPLKKDNLTTYLETNCEPVSDDEHFDVL